MSFRKVRKPLYFLKKNTRTPGHHETLGKELPAGSEEQGKVRFDLLFGADDKSGAWLPWPWYVKFIAPWFEPLVSWGVPLGLAFAAVWRVGAAGAPSLLTFLLLTTILTVLVSQLSPKIFLYLHKWIREQLFSGSGFFESAEVRRQAGQIEKAGAWLGLTVGLTIFSPIAAAWSYLVFAHRAFQIVREHWVLNNPPAADSSPDRPAFASGMFIYRPQGIALLLSALLYGSLVSAIFGLSWFSIILLLTALAIMWNLVEVAPHFRRVMVQPATWRVLDPVAWTWPLVLLAVLVMLSPWDRHLQPKMGESQQGKESSLLAGFEVTPLALYPPAGLQPIDPKYLRIIRIRRGQTIVVSPVYPPRLEQPPFPLVAPVRPRMGMPQERQGPQPQQPTEFVFRWTAPFKYTIVGDLRAGEQRQLISVSGFAYTRILSDGAPVVVESQLDLGQFFSKGNLGWLVLKLSSFEDVVPIRAEVVLVNTLTAETQSLGSWEIQRASWFTDELIYPMPKGGRLSNFNRVKLVFHWNPPLPSQRGLVALPYEVILATPDSPRAKGFLKLREAERRLRDPHLLFEPDADAKLRSP